MDFQGPGLRRCKGLLNTLLAKAAKKRERQLGLVCALQTPLCADPGGYRKHWRMGVLYYCCHASIIFVFEIGDPADASTVALFLKKINY
jgi:hypothetical protein